MPRPSRKRDVLPSGYRKTPQAPKEPGQTKRAQDRDTEDRVSVVEGVTWTGPQWDLIEWSATPAMDREPLTEVKLAEKLGVVPATLRNWKKKPHFWTEVRAIARSYMQKDLPDIFYALVDQAKLGSFPHIKLALELMGEYVEHSDVTTGGKPFPIQSYDYAAAIAQITGGSSSDS